MSSHCSLFRSTLHAAVLLGLLASATVTAAGNADSEASPDGFGLRTGEAPWPRWQGRLGVATSSPAPLGAPSHFDAGFGESGLPRQSLSLLGDYYFTQEGLAPESRYGGGFRATGGLLLNSRGVPRSLPTGAPSGLDSGLSVERRRLALWGPHLAPDSSESVPYVGVGYSGLKSVRGTGGGWGFSADVGVMALQPGSAVRLGQQGLSDTLRDLQLSPMLQVGVSYSF